MEQVPGLRRTRSRPRLLLFLARRSLLGSRGTFALLVIAIAAGAGLQIPNAANLAGFAEAILDDGLTRGAGDIRVEPRDAPRFDDGATEAARIAALTGAESATPILVYAGAVGHGGRFLGTPVYGIEFGAPHVPFHLTAGALLAPGDGTGVVLGSALATRLKVAIGDPVDVRAVFGPAEAALGEDNVGRFTMTVRGIVAGTAGGYRYAFVDRGFLAAQAGFPAAASSVIVHLADHFAAAATAARLETSLRDVRAIGWREDDPYLESYLSANRTISAVSYAMVIAAIAVPMWALLYIHVLKRRRELGILAALGFGRAELFAIYVLQSLVVAVIGCAIGAALGYGLVRYFQAHPIFEWESLVVRPLLDAASFAVPVLVIVATAVAAASYPAWRAARTDPAQVLRRLE